jgi:GTP pyrophosphokinase
MNPTEKDQASEIRSQYKSLLKAIRYIISHDEKRLIRKAFEDVLCSYREEESETGIKGYLHAISVARILAEEMELDTISIVSALLQDIPVRNLQENEQHRHRYSKKILDIVLNLQRISELRMTKISINPEIFIQLLLAISGDIRVILIRLADRLNLMRNINILSHKDQLQISLETSGLYAPLAHRLGLYKIKTELEELAMKYAYPEVYHAIERKIDKTREEQNRYFTTFIEPIRKELLSHGLKFDIKYRTKSIPSIWNKMKLQHIDFEQVYDFFAIRIITMSSLETEKDDCWKAYSLVTNIYQPNPSRLRDWISAPKASGYESLHTTVTGYKNKWVEVQIRSSRMDEAAEKGRAAHWKYKEIVQNASESADHWLKRIRSTLENYTPGEDEIDHNARIELFSDYVFAYTPQGDLKKLKAGATVLDFAFEVHSEIGQRCAGAKVNNRYAQLKQVLKTGDQVEIITSKNQKPNKDWLNYVTTSKAIIKIKRALKDEEFSLADTGKGMLQRKLSQYKVPYTDDLANRLVNHYKAVSTLDLFHGIAEGKYDLQKIKEALFPEQKTEEAKGNEKPFTRVESVMAGKEALKAMVIINDDTPMKDVKLSKCCQPVFGDDIFGFITVSEGIKIHRQNCTNAHQMLHRYAYRVVSARWAEKAEVSAYIATLRITGEDKIGILNNISYLLTTELNANVRSINLTSSFGKFDGTISVNVSGKSHLDLIMARLMKIAGVKKVIRLK